MIKIPFNIKSNDENIKIRRTDQNIPYIIHQTMKSQYVPTTMYNAVKTWIDKNPEYEYRYYDDKKCVLFLEIYFPKNIQIAYKMLYAGAAKADLWRLCVLYIHGGIYADIDTECNKPISNIINYDDDFVSMLAYRKPLFKITNAFIASIPRHPFVYSAINNIIKKINYCYYNRVNIKSPISLTGPSLLGKTLNILLNKKLTNRLIEKPYIVFNKKVRLFNLHEKKYFKFRYDNYNRDCKNMNIKTYHGRYGAYAFSYSYAKKVINNL